MMRCVCLLPVVPMRAEASDKAEMVSQMLFGNTCVVEQREEKWSYVCQDGDGYKGWVDNKQVILIEDSEYEIVCGWRGVVATSLSSIYLNNRLMKIPMGSKVPNGKSCVVAGVEVCYNEENPKLGLIDRAMLFYGAPYLWGGKTILGVDCSGFVQTVYGVQGIALPRDAWQQAQCGEPVEGVAAIKSGDLAFFCNPEGRIIHVGICMANNQIIHASGQVRIDKLDAQGIWNVDRLEYSHKLHSIRKLLL